MRANRKLWATATICVALVAGVTGCSQDKDKAAADPFAGLTADAIAEKAVATTKTATSLRMNGTGKTDGQDMTTDFTLDSKGSCKGSMSSGAGGEGKAEILRTGGFTYMKGDDAFWRSSSGEEGASADEAGAMSALLKGRWMKMPSEGDDNDLGSLCDLKTMIKEMDEENKGDRTGLTRGEDADVDGTAAVTLTKKKGAETTTFYVAKEGKPYVLRVVGAGGKEPGTVTFSEFDKPLTVAAPPADQIVDMAELAKLGGS
ncbi:MULTISPECIES: hypothetical protein [unclassified Streptomyces]|uniref:hypothetical protein n=1 Tax=unclassified Streptomyces TaxID=2593676 RepID=UPI0006FFAA16|nr:MULTISPECIES: hypothetical protein [unclassified Streptomyces]KQX58754.1 hypothetical protein ASD33_00095 [Streptomyces sp. Root1304]KRB00015.1 hypothetical protein ASE09_00095 [Streptomyces sp. Root66D1]